MNNVLITLGALMLGAGVGVLVMSLCVIAGRNKEGEGMDSIERITAERDKLRAFAQDIMEGWPDVNYLDGFDLQEIAHKHGLLVSETRYKSCGETCGCAEMVDQTEWDEGVTCYRSTPLLKGTP